MKPMLFCRIAWVHKYEGLRNDSISSGAGRFVKDDGWGGECWNYRPCGRMYGYVKLMGKATPRAVRERDRGLAKRAKRRFKQENGGRLFCQVSKCGFSFAGKFVEDVGNDFIGAHHVVPVAEGRRDTRLKDFMMLCSNCHRMVHRRMAEVGTLNREETLAIRNR